MRVWLKFCLCCTHLFAVSIYSQSFISSLRSSSVQEQTRLVLDISEDIPRKITALHNPERLIIDFENTKFLASSDIFTNSDSLIQGIRANALGQSDLRMV